MKRALAWALPSLLAVSGAAFASPILDQSFTTTGGGFYATVNDWQQGLTVGSAGELTSI